MLARLPDMGVGVLGAMVDSPNELLNELLKELLNELLRARGEEDPKLCRRPVSLPPVGNALWSNGLDAGEKVAPDETRRSEKVGVADRGEPL